MTPGAASRTPVRFAARWALLLLAGCAASRPERAPPAAHSGVAVAEITIEAREGTHLAFDLSPDGRTIVFDLLGQLWLLPVEGGEARPLTDAVRDTADDLDPSFSPDGRWIVFRSDRPGGRGLWRVPAEGGEPRRLTHAPSFMADDLGPAWSPDGRRIGFVRSQFPAGILWILDPATVTRTEVAIDGLPAGGVGQFDWAPDGRRFVLISGSGQRLGTPFGTLWEADVDGGTATPLADPELRASAPAYSPDGDRIALFARDPANRVQLHVWTRGAGHPQRLTDHLDTTPLRVRWSPEGETLFYSADGKLWRIAAAGGAPVEIPFTARLNVVTRRAELPQVRLAPPGAQVPVRGHQGVELSPDGGRVAWIALEKLWLFDLGGQPVPIADVPADAEGVAWSPDGREVVWTAGPPDSRDLFAANVRTGAIRRLTALPGRSMRPSWSPDGRHIAFIHAHGEGAQRRVRLRLIPADTASVQRIEATLDLGDADGLFLLGNQRPQWAPDGRAVLLASFWGARLMPLQGPPRMLEDFGPAASNVRWRADGSVVYIEENALWRARFDTVTGGFRDETQLAADAAISMSAGHDGRLLYLSSDGLRLLRADSISEAFGWPLRYRAADAPAPLLIREVRIIDGRGSQLSGLRDLLVEGGRIARIGPAGTLPSEGATRVIEGGGRTVIPGLIELHVHLFDDAQPPLLLAEGITTVRDVGSRITHTAALREAIEAGVHPGPRIVFGGMQFYPFGGVSGGTTETPQEPRDHAGVVRGLDLARAFGADYVKMRFPPDWTTGARLIDEAHARGMPVSGHVALPLAMIAAGIDGMEHLGPGGIRTDGIIYDDVVQVFRAARLRVVPTVVYHSVGDWLKEDPALLDDPTRAPALSPNMRRQATVVRARPASGNAEPARLSAAVLHRGGVAIAAGSDVVSIPWALHWELAELVEAGLTPMEAITAATSTAASILGLAHELGTIEEGKRADLVILDADPLEDIRNTRQIWMVIQGGKVVDRDALLASPPPPGVADSDGEISWP